MSAEWLSISTCARACCVSQPLCSVLAFIQTAEFSSPGLSRDSRRAMLFMPVNLAAKSSSAVPVTPPPIITSSYFSVIFTFLSVSNTLLLYKAFGRRTAEGFHPSPVFGNPTKAKLSWHKQSPQNLLCPERRDPLHRSGLSSQAR